MIIRTRAYLEQILESIGRIDRVPPVGPKPFFKSTLLQDGIISNSSKSLRERTPGPKRGLGRPVCRDSQRSSYRITRIHLSDGLGR